MPRRGLSKLNSVSLEREDGIALEARACRPNGSVDIPRTAGALKRRSGSKRRAP